MASRCEGWSPIPARRKKGRDEEEMGGIEERNPSSPVEMKKETHGRTLGKSGRTERVKDLWLILNVEGRLCADFIFLRQTYRAQREKLCSYS